tara:strand:+ start:306 stop:563 length:258 start_codon:yes stop_codon:yes gene_type:complete
MWIKNTNGKRDAMLTFATFAFLIVTLNILLATFGKIAYQGWGIEIGFQMIDSSLAGTYLAATLGAYVARRYTDKKYEEPSDGEAG